jgi:hypothetical protein
MFCQSYDYFEVDSGLMNKTDRQKTMTLFHYIGITVLRVYNTFTWPAGENKDTLSTTLAKVAAYYIPKRNIVFVRHIFNSRRQAANESLDIFITDLRLKMRICEFGTLADSLLISRIVGGINDEKLRERLLQSGKLTSQQAIDFCHASESIIQQLSVMKAGIASSKKLMFIELRFLVRFQFQISQQPTFDQIDEICKYNGHAAVTEENTTSKK